ncbi:hypothetical protein NEUTE1DRAFT_115504 [Neurospora tetrasperma FGSC 2508]|uniref:Uncharacterized protein n=1 Tax=Neurospora tetrasperma (strain FGSC 2508 / ATCC MYA-4615 / P0657) TaxID=510951 RepID=F8MZN5_NEUT8|nr:hypothetical protein NEUTE1DRAFT_115504 [Neurospora tetrasperma FGSC 2508]
MSMGGGFYRGLDDSAKNAAAVSRTVFIAFAVECTVPLTPSPAEWARHTLHKYIYLEGIVGFWKVWLALVNTFLQGMELQKPPIPPIVPDDEEWKRRVFADVDEFIVTIHERSLYLL